MVLCRKEHEKIRFIEKDENHLQSDANGKRLEAKLMVLSVAQLSSESKASQHPKIDEQIHSRQKGV